jgi:hypothetical protein
MTSLPSSPAAQGPQGWRLQWERALKQPALEVFFAEGGPRPDGPSADSQEVRRAAYWAALVLGECRLRNIDLDDLDGALPVALAATACARLVERLAGLVKDAERLAEVLERETGSFEATEPCFSLLEGRMEVWAAFVAIDEAYQAGLDGATPEQAALARALDTVLDRTGELDRLMQREVELLTPVADFPLLENWRRQLVAPYNDVLPWWLDGCIEAEARRLRDEEVAWLPRARGGRGRGNPPRKEALFLPTKVEMKLHSPYLNPFQPFPERGLDGQGEERPRFAIEDNMSRAVFSALANAEHPGALVLFLEKLAEQALSSALQARTQTLAAVLSKTEASKIEIDLQSWPTAALQDKNVLKNTLLIGISSSHREAWTHDQRLAPSSPRADAWICVPGEMLVVFECKNDEHPLDATQMSAYAHQLGIFTAGAGVPCAEPGSTLDSPEEAQAVQAACRDRVIDASWSAVVDALTRIQEEKNVENRGCWLAGQAAEYIRLHVRPPYREPQTILDWLEGPDTPDRREHLRTLVKKMGESLAEDWEMRPGVDAAVYVRPSQDQDRKTLRLEGLGKTARLALWFQFTEGGKKEPIGLEYYLQAPGAQPARKKGKPITKDAWNEASRRHSDCANQFEGSLSEWVCNLPSGSRVDVTTVRFKGKKREWQGGGIKAPDGPTLLQATPEEALKFIRTNKPALWRFPPVGPDEEVEEVADKVRKPALSLRLPLDLSALAACRNDRAALQTFLRNAVARITPS